MHHVRKELGSRAKIIKLASRSPVPPQRTKPVADLDDIYSGRILELAGAISHTTRLPGPKASATAHSKLCGSTVTVDLTVENGRVTAFGQVVKACLLGQAACAIMAREITGTGIAELQHVGACMRAMLKTDGAPPNGRWADLAVLEPVRAYKGRHASVLLVFDAVEAALMQDHTQDHAAKPAVSA
jgi:NifU-like protein involved in Fe-S cluster formation